MKRCIPKHKKKEKRRVSLSLSQNIWEKFNPFLKNTWQGSFTSWVEFAMECYSRDTCEGCPYNEPDLEKEKGIGKKIIT